MVFSKLLYLRCLSIAQLKLQPWYLESWYDIWSRPSLVLVLPVTASFPNASTYLAPNLKLLSALAIAAKNLTQYSLSGFSINSSDESLIRALINVDQEAFHPVTVNSFTTTGAGSTTTGTGTTTTGSGTIVIGSWLLQDANTNIPKHITKILLVIGYS